MCQHGGAAGGGDGGGEGGGQGGGTGGGGDGDGGGGDGDSVSQTRFALVVQSDTILSDAVQTLQLAHVPDVMVPPLSQTCAPVAARAHMHR
jgi:hypothetical protein